MIGKTVRLKDSVAEDDFNKRGIEPCHLKSMKNTQLKVLGILEPIQQKGGVEDALQKLPLLCA